MKNKILKGITGLAVLVALLSMCAVDGDFRNQALVAMPLAAAWLALYCFANRDKLKGR